MKNLGEELKSLIPKGFAERQAAAVKKLEEHPEVKRLKENFPERVVNLTHPTNYGAISRHITSFDNCRGCTELTGCQNDHKGHCSIVEENPKDDKDLIYRLQKCPLLVSHEKRQKVMEKIKSHFIPEHIVNATFEDIEPDSHRVAAIMKCMEFCENFKAGKSKRGIYLYGQFGVGKSQIAGAIAQELASQGVDVAMVYVPDFMAEAKDAISSKTETVLSKLEALQNVTVLILDDIGAEALTIWTRDEILGPILQRRMERLVTIYTSNLTMKELRQHLLNVKNIKEIDHRQNVKKVERILERIEPFVEVLHVGGRNRRREG
ncbi:ATP-binding protein [Paenibacillus donghaensis]|uniref:DNA replication protein n=1 Tax=Paenibacillus donghaensis TaxID=414771 RepID=A0A2Z2K7C2_9BACL|nr:ATP-binding protein [Paenibacillus donghaensis]ASA20907.1 DNA replication protein [Paenibacillus donghaensis]